MNWFEVVSVIERPDEGVFAVVEDVIKIPLWEPGLLEVRRASEGRLGGRDDDSYGRVLGAVV